MMQITPKFVKLIDKLEIQEAPEVFNGIAGFNHNRYLCLEHGFKELKQAVKTGNTAVYEEEETTIIQSWTTIDLEKYGERASELIRERYSIDSELAIQRQREESTESFLQYFEFCEKCKKQAKLEQIENIKGQ